MLYGFVLKAVIKFKVEPFLATLYIIFDLGMFRSSSSGYVFSI